jgi:hypothetical protein
MQLQIIYTIIRTTFLANAHQQSYISHVAEPENLRALSPDLDGSKYNKLLGKNLQRTYSLKGTCKPGKRKQIQF